jgi:predicted RNA binding protein YcfA (HicA-like mRNA interferase family)
MPAIRPIHYQELIRVFEADGFRFDRQEGSHRIYIKAGVPRPLVIPAYRDVPIFIIRNLLRTAGMSRERYFELLSPSNKPEGEA